MSIAAKCDCGKYPYFCGNDCPKSNIPSDLLYEPTPSTPDCSKGNEAILRKALAHLIFLHGCEQEGMSGGMPTREMWLSAVDQAVEAMEKTGGQIFEPNSFQQ